MQQQRRSGPMGVIHTTQLKRSLKRSKPAAPTEAQVDGLLDYAVIGGWIVLLRFDIKETGEMVAQELQFLDPTSPHHLKTAILNLLPLLSPAERAIIMAFDKYTCSGQRGYVGKLNKHKECYKASWSGAGVCSGMATCVGLINQRRPCLLVPSCVPKELLMRALPILRRFADISVFLAVPADDDYMLCGYDEGSVAMTAFCGAEGAVLMRKKPNSPATPMPSTEVTAGGAEDDAQDSTNDLKQLPVSWGCGDVIQVLLKSGAVCVPANPQSLTRVGLSAPFGCSRASTGSKVCPPRTHPRSVPGKGQQVVRWEGVGLPEQHSAVLLCTGAAP